MTTATKERPKAKTTSTSRRKPRAAAQPETPPEAPPEAPASFTIEPKQFRQILRNAALTVGSLDRHLNRCQITIDAANRKLTVVSTDSYCLLRQEVTLTGESQLTGGLLYLDPKWHLAALPAPAFKERAPITVAATDDTVAVRWTHGEVLDRVAASDRFPNWRDLLPDLDAPAPAIEAASTTAHAAFSPDVLGRVLRAATDARDTSAWRFRFNGPHTPTAMVRGGHGFTLTAIVMPQRADQ